MSEKFSPDQATDREFKNAETTRLLREILEVNGTEHGVLFHFNRTDADEEGAFDIQLFATQTGRTGDSIIAMVVRNLMIKDYQTVAKTALAFRTEIEAEAAGGKEFSDLIRKYTREVGSQIKLQSIMKMMLGHDEEEKKSDGPSDPD